MPSFLHPKDPFVALKSDNLIGPDRVAAQRPDPDAKGALPCRLPSSVVAGLTLSGTVSKTFQAANLFGLNAVPDALGSGGIAQALALESLLFDPSSAGLIDFGDPGLAALFGELQSSLDPSCNSGAGRLTWLGRPPDPLSVTPYGKANPWLPVYLMWQVRWAPGYAPDTGVLDALAGWQFGSDQPPTPANPLDTLVGDLIPDLIPKTQSGSGPPPGNDVLIEGATLITPLSNDRLTASLREFATASGSGPGVMARTQALGQSLGGFNDLLLRQGLGLFLPSFDPLDAEIWKALGQEPQPVMPVAGAFLPVRVGALKLVNAWIVDSFGQTRKLVDSGPSSASPVPAIVASASLPPPLSGYHAGFSPRLVQPTRLNFDWEPADDSAPGPVCGWVVPNYLEKSLAVFAAGGEALGTLESVLPALGQRTIDSPVTFRWTPIPGSALAIAGVANERLRNFVALVAGFTADEGQAFLELVDRVLQKTDGRVPADNPAMAVLLGRPLALVSAALGLEFDGLPAGYWNTAGTAWSFETGGFERLRVPVRLGGMSLSADGLVAWMPEDASVLVAGHGATRRVTGAKLRYDRDLTVACADAKPVSLTLLMDTGARVFVETGILPRFGIALPPEAARRSGLIADVYVGAAPVLGQRLTGDPATPLTMPQPSDAFGRWSWATRPDVAAKIWRNIRPADDRARFADDLALSEGWLRLHPDPNPKPADKTQE
jgi:hypothetical protein